MYNMVNKLVLIRLHLAAFVEFCLTSVSAERLNLSNMV